MPVPFFILRDVIHASLFKIRWDKTKGGPMPPFSTADPQRLIGALAHPFATGGGEDLYPSIPAKAAALFRGLVKNHGLPDGNKRLGATTLGVFLQMNGWTPRYTNNQLYRYALRVAAHKGSYPVVWIEGWIRRHARPMPQPERETVRRRNRKWLHDGLMSVAFDSDE